MKPQIALSPEQMHELQSLGLDCSDASMVCINFNGTHAYVGGEEVEEITKCINGTSYVEISRAYTIEDIIFKLEADITYNDAIANQPDTFAGQPVEKTPWECSYSHLVGFATLKHSLCCGLSWGKTPMEAAFNALKEVQECFPDKIKRL